MFVAIAAFILGVFFERASNGTRGAHLISPRSVTGRVAYRTELGALAGDSEAVVIVVPTDHRPDEKLDVAALRPEAPPPGETHPTIAKLRSIGGDFARAGPDGDFALEVPNAGKYFVLMISGHLPRPAGQQPTNQELAQIARYFVPADELLGMNAYRWSEELVRDNVKLSHTFE